MLTLTCMLIGPLTPAAALAQAASGPAPHRLAQVHENWGGQTMIPVQWIVIALGVVLIVVGALAFRQWSLASDRRPRPWRVFYSVANSLGLPLYDQWLLMRIARHEALPTPLTLLLSPRTMRYHAQQFADAHPRRKAAVMTRVANIRRTVFGEGD